MQLIPTLVLLVAGGLTLAAASPVNKKPANDEGEIVILPLDTGLLMEDGDGFPGGYFSFNPFGNPFSGFLQSMDEMLKSLRDQMTQVLHRLPAEGNEFSEIGNGKGNTTSTTKVINGHKVTVNETTYSNQGENSGSIFKIRIVDVHPASEEETDTSSDNKPQLVHHVDTNVKDVEEVTKKIETLDRGSPEIEDSANEIPRGKPEIDNGFEGDIEIPNEELVSDSQFSETVPNTLFSPEIITSEGDRYIANVPEIETNDVNVYPYDLSKDTDVNQILADQGAPINPDAEIIDTNGRLYDLSQDTLINQNYFLPTTDILQEEETRQDVETLKNFERILMPSAERVK